MKRFFAFLLILLMLFSYPTQAQALQSITSTGTASTVHRLAGLDRYETAAAIAKEGWSQSNYAIIVCGDNYPDALVSAPAAQMYKAPILLSYKDTLPLVTRQVLFNLRVKNVILIGGSGVLSDNLTSELIAMGVTPNRWAGQDRYETSLIVASHISNISQAAVATGEDFADALSIASVAALKKMPILLAPQNEISDAARSFLKQHNLTKTYIIGNREQISDAVAAQFPNAERIIGITKYDRNIAVIQKFKEDFTGNSVYAATGNDYADALAGTALAAQNKAPVVLVSNPLSEATHVYLDQILVNKSLNILGGTGVVSDSLFQNSNPNVTKFDNTPLFESSFIQSWYCKDWDFNRWQNELAMLKNVGINELIIQNTVDNTPANRNASYKTTIPGYSSNSVDLLETALTAADAIGVIIRVGTGDNEDWWRKGASDSIWLANEANINKQIVDEIASKYASHPSFSGWYLSYEISNITATTKNEQSNLNTFFKSIVSEMKTKTPNKSVMISPFYNSQLGIQIGAQVSLTNWAVTLNNVFKGTGIDILALQDSVGADYNKVSQLPSILAATKEGTDAAGLRLYANTETYTSTPTGNVPASQNQIVLQMEAAKPYVTGFIAFSINHYQGKYSDDPSIAAGYDAYKSYYYNTKK